jgi:hypothetical protein
MFKKMFKLGCNKFLTLGFGYEQEKVLGFQGRMFSLIFG